MQGRALKPQELHDIVEIVTKGSIAAPATLARAAANRRAALVRELKRYGEDAVASSVEALPDDRVDSIHNKGMAIAFTGFHIPMSLCLAAVEEIEGASRPLVRKRRKSAT